MQKAHRTLGTFGFCRHTKPTLQKPKEPNFANARTDNTTNENRT